MTQLVTNTIFEFEHSDTLFVSYGASSDVRQSASLSAVIQSIASGVEIRRLIDRDDMTDREREDQIAQGVNVLVRRELENYLYDPAVLTTFLREIGHGHVDSIVCSFLSQRAIPSMDTCDVKQFSRDLLNLIRQNVSAANLGNTRREFELQFLAPAIARTPAVFKELQHSVFPDKD